ncbi:MAG: hypothetical protein ACD_12C00687G0002 [uncultured bacterium]|nr:MAG: hypothetical protein ACD_12C00687G0002 [uncultured bacterium]
MNPRVDFYNNYSPSESSSRVSGGIFMEKI